MMVHWPHLHDIPRIRIGNAIDSCIYETSPGWESCVRHEMRYTVSKIQMTLCFINMPFSRLMDWQPSDHDDVGT